MSPVEESRGGARLSSESRGRAWKMLRGEKQFVAVARAGGHEHTCRTRLIGGGVAYLYPKLVYVKLSVGVTGHPYLLEIDCLFTQGS